MCNLLDARSLWCHALLGHDMPRTECLSPCRLLDRSSRLRSAVAGGPEPSGSAIKPLIAVSDRIATLYPPDWRTGLAWSAAPPAALRLPVFPTLRPAREQAFFPTHPLPRYLRRSDRRRTHHWAGEACLDRPLLAQLCRLRCFRGLATAYLPQAANFNLVEVDGIEPTTSCLQSRCSPN